jgi:hypothetical protein
LTAIVSVCGRVATTHPRRRDAERTPTAACAAWLSTVSIGASDRMLGCHRAAGANGAVEVNQSTRAAPS